MRGLTISLLPVMLLWAGVSSHPIASEEKEESPKDKRALINIIQLLGAANMFRHNVGQISESSVDFRTATMISENIDPSNFFHYTGTDVDATDSAEGIFAQASYLDSNKNGDYNTKVVDDAVDPRATDYPGSFEESDYGEASPTLSLKEDKAYPSRSYNHKGVSETGQVSKEDPSDDGESNGGD